MRSPRTTEPAPRTSELRGLDDHRSHVLSILTLEGEAEVHVFAALGCAHAQPELVPGRFPRCVCVDARLREVLPGSREDPDPVRLDVEPEGHRGKGRVTRRDALAPVALAAEVPVTVLLVSEQDAHVGTQLLVGWSDREEVDDLAAETSRHFPPAVVADQELREFLPFFAEPFRRADRVLLPVADTVGVALGELLDDLAAVRERLLRILGVGNDGEPEEGVFLPERHELFPECPAGSADVVNRGTPTNDAEYVRVLPNRLEHGVEGHRQHAVTAHEGFDVCLGDAVLQEAPQFVGVLPEVPGNTVGIVARKGEEGVNGIGNGTPRW